LRARDRARTTPLGWLDIEVGDPSAADA
jgi:hypothetical protein